MKRLFINIAGADREYLEAFSETVAAEYPSYAIGICDVCEGCMRDCDVCLNLLPENGYYGADGNIPGFGCSKSVRGLDPYAGVSALLSKLREIVSESETNTVERDDGLPGFSEPIPKEKLLTINTRQGLCVSLCFSFSGGTGTSCVSLAIARELSRYRDKKTLLLCLDEFEQAALCADESATGLTQSEMLYRYQRLFAKAPTDDSVAKFLTNSVYADEYGVLRLKRDTGVSAFSGLSACVLEHILEEYRRALNLGAIVLDLGKRLRTVEAISDGINVLCVEIRPETEQSEREDAIFPESAVRTYVFENQYCTDDIIKEGNAVKIGLSNSFGLAIKKLCDKLVGADESESMLQRGAIQREEGTENE